MELQQYSHIRNLFYAVNTKLYIIKHILLTKKKKGRQIHTKLWQENLKETVHLEDLDVNRSLILKCASNRKAGSGFGSSSSR
jgi:hypothetical protein